MKKLLIAAAALALAGPTLAQTTTGTTTTGGTTTAGQTTAAPPADGAMATPSTAGQPAGPQMGTPSQAPTAVATPSDPKALIASEFPTYDKDGNGTLDKTEFAAWMDALKAKTGQPAQSAAARETYDNGAFTTADKDKSKSISLAELQTYLTAGA